MKGIGNNDQISFVEVNYEKPSDEIFFYEEEINFWGKLKRKEGFHKKTLWGLEEIKGIPTGFFVNGNTMIEKANLKIEFSNGRIETIYFNSDNEMMVFIKREFQGRKWQEFS